MAYYLIIRGPAGVGKTTVAKKIADKLKAKYISFDEVLRKFQLKKHDEKGRIAKECYLEANDKVVEEAKSVINSGGIVLFDGCFYHKVQLDNLIESLPFRHFVFDLKATIDECIDRDTKRKGKGEDSIRAVFKMVSEFDCGNRIETEGKSADEVVEELLNIIKKNKIYVDPRHEGHGFDLPFWRDNNKLWALEIPEEEMNIDDFEWMMEIPFWEDNDGNIAVTPNEVINDIDKYPGHKERIGNCDTSFAIHIMKNVEDKWTPLDGLHRLVKQKMEGKKVIMVKKVSKEQVWLTKKEE